MKKITLEMPVVTKCLANECVYNAKESSNNNLNR